MSLQSEDHAILSEGAYYDTNTARELAKSIHPDFDVDESLSDKHTKTYHNHTTKETIVAFRGCANKKDVITDAMLFLNLGGQTKRFKDAQNHTQRVIEKYGKENTSLTGHSLAGEIASSVSKKTNLPAITFSKGRKLLPSRDVPKEKSFRAVGDVLSGTSVLASAISSPALLYTGGFGKLPDFRKGHPHSLKQFQN